MKKPINKLSARMDAAMEAAVLLLLAAWCFAAFLFKIFTVGVFGDFTALDVFAQSDFRLFALLAVLAAFVCLTVCNLAERRVGAARETVLLRLLCVGFGGYCAVTLPVCSDPYFWLVLCALWAALLAYALEKRGGRSLRISVRGAVLCVAGVAAAFAVVVGVTGALRYLTFRTPNFDFGIFSQLFEGMKRRGLPVTTCERDRPLSHFAVHLSPILYLLLPVYWLFPSPVTLQAAQAVVLASAAAPMALLCRRIGLSPAKTALLTSVALLHPAVVCGVNYDFHENCFLLPLLLWLFYCFEKGKLLPAFLCAALVLAVKEDAAVYLAFFALFVLLDKKRYAPGLGLLALSLAWFLAALKFLTVYGEGVMTTRYGNYIAAEGGLWEAVQNALRDPAFTLTQLFAEEDGGRAGKLLYALQLFVPLGMLPFGAKRPSRLLLLLPAVLVNFMTVYVYQYDIGFQYSFGSAAFLLYLSAINCAEMKPAPARLTASVAAVACLLFAVQNTLPRAAEYLRYYAAHRTDFAVMEDYLASLPEDASVACSTWLVAHLADRETLYEAYYHDPATGDPPDFVIVTDAGEELAPYLAVGYTQSAAVTNGDAVLLRVFTLPDEK